MVLPVQVTAGLQGDPDAELAFALRGRAPKMHWVLPERIEAAVQRSPGLGARATGLPVGVFLQAEVERVGDPLYGQLRRLAALVDAEVALLPVRVAPGPMHVTGRATVQVFAALVAVRSGRVLWFGVVEGTPGPPGGPGPLASAMERLARTLLWYEAR